MRKKLRIGSSDCDAKMTYLENFGSLSESSDDFKIDEIDDRTVNIPADGRIRNVVRSALSRRLVIPRPRQVVHVEEPRVWGCIDANHSAAKFEHHVNGIEEMPNGFVI